MGLLKFFFLIGLMIVTCFTITFPESRKEIFLDGTWMVSYDGTKFDHKLKVPGMIPIEPETYPEPIAHEIWYKKSFYLEQGYKKVFLKFYAVDNRCTVYINGSEVFRHSGGFDSFKFEITPYLRLGENEVIVHVEDLPLNQFNGVAGKQNWYGNCIGIWQSVELILIEKDSFFENCVFEIGDSQIKIESSIVGEWDEIHYFLLDNDRIILQGSSRSSNFVIEPHNVEKWTLKNPKLYLLKINLLKDRKIVDTFRKKIGFRRIEVKDGKILLNGEPIYIKGLLDQDFWPETGYVAPSKKVILEQFNIVKRMGFNLIRYHVKIPPKEYVEAADEVGIMLWIDLPYARKLNDSSKHYLEKLAVDLKNRYSGNPSFLILTLINESWGLDLNNSRDRNWLKSFWQSSKVLLPDRLVVDNSPCFGNYHISSDINDYHFYYSFPDNRAAWYSTIKRFASGDLKTFNLSLKDLFDMLTKRKTLNKEEKLPKIVSEFGTWGLPDSVLWEGKWYKYPIFNGESVESKMKNFESIFYTNPTEMILESQWKQFWTLKYQIETMRLYPQITGYVITQLTDLSWEANGILDFSRNPKVFANYLKWLNSEILPIYHDGKIYVSNISTDDFKGKLILKSSLEKEFEIYIPAFSTLEVSEFKDETNYQFIQLEVRKNSGETLGKNFYYLFKIDKLRNDSIKIVNGLDDNILKEIKEGKTILLKAHIGKYLDGKLKVVPSRSTAYIFSGYRTDWQGNWIGTFYYFHPLLKDIFSGVSGVLKLSNYLNNNVIVIDEDLDSRILIGKYVGWNLARCAYLVEIKYGKGKLIVTTLNLEKTKFLKELYKRLKSEEGVEK